MRNAVKGTIAAVGVAAALAGGGIAGQQLTKKDSDIFERPQRVNHTEQSLITQSSTQKGMRISFTAQATAYENGFLIFVYEDKRIVIKVPCEAGCDSGSVLMIDGIVSEINGSEIILSSAEITSLDSESGAVVYVSASGKYHADPECSRMKEYTEMTLSQALAEGCTACSICIG